MPNTTGDIEDWLDAALEKIDPTGSKTTQRAFTRYVVEQEMSKKGRFYRVHFRSSAVLDFVPKGSIAIGMALIRDEQAQGNSRENQFPQWRFIYPPLNTLWQQFDDEFDRRMKRSKSKATSL